MNIQYLSVLAIISLLSLGNLTSCSSPTGTVTSKNVTTEAKSNPCASKDKLTEVKQSKSNPCASKAKSITGSLAPELQGKPVVVDVFATWCPGCKNIAPTLSALKKEYSGKVNFVVLDVTDKAKVKETEAKAAKLGLSKFLAENKSKTSTVAIIDPATGNILATFKNNPLKDDYSQILDDALAKI